MNEHMTVGELFYCLIEDIEDYTMRNEDDGLDYIVQLLDGMKEHWDNQSFEQLDLTKLISIISYLHTREFKQFEEDTNVIYERIQNENRIF